MGTALAVQQTQFSDDTLRLTQAFMDTFTAPIDITAHRFDEWAESLGQYGANPQTSDDQIVTATRRNLLRQRIGPCLMKVHGHDLISVGPERYRFVTLKTGLGLKMQRFPHEVKQVTKTKVSGLRERADLLREQLGDSVDPSTQLSVKHASFVADFTERNADLSHDLLSKLSSEYKQIEAMSGQLKNLPLLTDGENDPNDPNAA